MNRSAGNFVQIDRVKDCSGETKSRRSVATRNSEGIKLCGALSEVDYRSTYSVISVTLSQRNCWRKSEVAQLSYSHENHVAKAKRRVVSVERVASFCKVVGCRKRGITSRDNYASQQVFSH